MAGAGEVLVDRADRAKSQATAFVGMAIFLASWAMMFAALFFSYGIVRSKSLSWPPVGAPSLPVGLAALNTMVIAASSAVLTWGLRRARRGRVDLLAWAVAGTLLLGALFIALQAKLWTDLRADGLTMASGQYGSVLYSLTWVHAIHVAVGLVALAWMCARAFAGSYSPERHLPVRLWALYWHFVGVVWLLIFLLVFLV